VGSDYRSWLLAAVIEGFRGVVPPG